MKSPFVSDANHTGIFVPNGWDEFGKARPLIEVKVLNRYVFTDSIDLMVDYVELNSPVEIIKSCFESSLIYKEVEE